MSAIEATGDALDEIAVDVDARTGVMVSCHLCGKRKGGAGTGPARALYLLAFHYDRRHRGWTSSVLTHFDEREAEAT